MSKSKPTTPPVTTSTFSVRVDRDALLRALESCVRIARAKSTMPVLANVCLTTHAGGFDVAATDLCRAVTVTVSAEVVTSGSVAVNAKDLLERVKVMTPGELTVTSDESCNTTIKGTGSRRFKVVGLPGAEFPTVPGPADDAAGYKLNTEQLGRILGKTFYAISVDTSRLHLNSLLVECKPKAGPAGCSKLTAVSTNGHQLSVCSEPVTGDLPNGSLLIPRDAVEELRRICASVAGEIELSQTGANLFFSAGDTLFSAKLTDASFPPWETVLPKECTKTVTANREQFVDVLKAVSKAAEDRSSTVRFTLEDGKLTVEASSPDSGEGQDELAVDYRGERLVIGFNGKYLIDALIAMGGDEVVLGLSGDLDPLLITPPTQTDGADTRSVLMPCRVNGAA